MSWISLQWRCPEHGVFDTLEDRADQPDSVPCTVWHTVTSISDEPGFIDVDDRPCGHPSPRTLAVAVGKVKIAEVQQGGSATRPPGVLDTRPLADGMPLNEWKAKRAKVHKAERKAAIRKNT